MNLGISIESRLARAEKFKFEFTIIGPVQQVRFYYPRDKYHLLFKKIKWFFEESRKHYIDVERPILSAQYPGREGYVKITPCVWSHHSLPKTLEEEQKGGWRYERNKV